jgi:hypothetical protein
VVTVEIVLPSGSIKRDGGHEQRSNYENTSVRRKQRLDIFCFCRLRLQPIAEQSAVGLRAAVFGRRASFDDSEMHEPRRSTAESVPACAGYSIAHVTAVASLPDFEGGVPMHTLWVGKEKPPHNAGISNPSNPSNPFRTPLPQNWRGGGGRARCDIGGLE